MNIGTYKIEGTNVEHGEGWASTSKTCEEDHDQDLIDLIQTSTTTVFDESTGILTLGDVAGTLLTLKVIL